MLFFNKKYTLADSGILNGFTDWHCHLLPGVDDGVGTLDETLAILDTYRKHGVKKVWLTPHVMEDCPNAPADLQCRYEALKKEYSALYRSDAIELHLASEHMLDNLFDSRLAKGDVLPIAADNSLLLVETSYFTAPYNMEGKLDDVKRAGYYPLLAHPERYRYMEEKDYDRLLSQSIRLQLDLYSLLSLYDPVAEHKARMLLKKGAYSVVGTDTHSLRQLQAALNSKALKSDDIRRLEQILAASPL